MRTQEGMKVNRDCRDCKALKGLGREAVKIRKGDEITTIYHK